MQLIGHQSQQRLLSALAGGGGGNSSDQISLDSGELFVSIFNLRIQDETQRRGTAPILRIVEQCELLLKCKHLQV